VDKLKKWEDQFIKTVQHPAIARLLTLVVVGAVVLTKMRPELEWPRWVIEVGAALGIYGSIHREQKE